MEERKHLAVFTSNTSQTDQFIDALLENKPPKDFNYLKDAKGSVLSRAALERFMDKEDRHDHKVVTAYTQQSLKSMSSGEQKKALLKHILASNPDFIILNNPFDNLDADSQAALKTTLQEVSENTDIIQFLSRKVDLLAFTNTFARLEGSQLTFYENAQLASKEKVHEPFKGNVPKPLNAFLLESDVLIQLKQVNVTYLDRPILKNIDWTIKKGEFWELRGKNGSGKTTILSMITGEKPERVRPRSLYFWAKKGDRRKCMGY